MKWLLDDSCPSYCMGMQKPIALRKNRNSGFTLVELLVVITIIAVLAGLGMSGMKSIRERAQQTTSMNNMRALYTGHQVYLAEFNHFPQANLKATTGPEAGTCTWHERVSPYVGLPTDLDKMLSQWVEGQKPPGVFHIPGRKRLVEDNGGQTDASWRSGYIRNGAVYVNNDQVNRGKSFRTLSRVSSVSQTFFFIDLGGEHKDKDWNGWQVDKANIIKAPAHGGEGEDEPDTMRGNVNVCFMDGSVQTKKKGDLPLSHEDVFWKFESNL